MNKKILFITILILIIIGILAFIGIRIKKSVYKPVIISNDNNIVCTQEAKICSDGSYVARTGPNCEFAECSEAATPSSAQLYSNPKYNETVICNEELDCCCHSAIINIDTGEDILKPYNLIEAHTYWSSDNKTLAVKSVASPIGGEGIDGLYVSDYGYPEKLNLVKDVTGYYAGGNEIMVINFVDNEKMTFSAKYYYENTATGYIADYEYNVKTKELKELNRYNLIDQ